MMQGSIHEYTLAQKTTSAINFLLVFNPQQNRTGDDLEITEEEVSLLKKKLFLSALGGLVLQEY